MNWVLLVVQLNLVLLNVHLVNFRTTSGWFISFAKLQCLVHVMTLVAVGHAWVAVKGWLWTLIVGCLAQIVEEVLIRECLLSMLVLIVSVDTTTLIVKLSLTEDLVISNFLTVGWAHVCQISIVMTHWPSSTMSSNFLSYRSSILHAWVSCLRE